MFGRVVVFGQKTLYKANNALLLDKARRSLEKASCSAALGAICKVPFPEPLGREPFVFFSGGPKQEPLEYQASCKALSKTIGKCAPMLTYHAACAVLFSSFSPQHLNSAILLCFPWYSSANFTEWPCVDVICSSLKEKTREKYTKQIPHQFLPEISEVKEKDRACFILCMILLFGTYGFVNLYRFGVTKFLLQKHGPSTETLKQFAADVICEGAQMPPLCE